MNSAGINPMGDNVQDQVGVAAPNHSSMDSDQPGATIDVDDVASDDGQYISGKSTAQRHKPSPTAPSRQEIAEHNIDHWPFRSWCADCVCGKATGDHHRVTKDKEDDRCRIPILAFDYAFMSNHGEKRETDTEVSEAKILVGKDSKSKNKSDQFKSSFMLKSQSSDRIIFNK